MFLCPTPQPPNLSEPRQDEGIFKPLKCSLQWGILLVKLGGLTLDGGGYSIAYGNQNIFEVSSLQASGSTLKTSFLLKHFAHT